MDKNQDFRHIVRIASKDLNGNQPIYRSLAKIKGIGIRLAKNIAVVFEKETGIDFNSKLGGLSEEMDKKLEDIVLNPKKHGIPIYNLNKRKDIFSGEDKHLVMADLDFQMRNEFQLLNQIKSYRGLRRSWGLPVRGQRTKSTHRGKGGVVGVTKKDVIAAAAPAKKEGDKK